MLASVELLFYYTSWFWMNRRTIFWPLDVDKTAGIFFGWDEEFSTIVSGVLPTLDHEDGARNLSVVLKNPTESVKELLGLAGHPPTLLGSCRFTTPKTITPQITLFGDKSGRSACNFIYYRRPQLSMLRFYSLAPLRLDITEPDAVDSTPTNKLLSSLMVDLNDMDFSKHHLTATSLAPLLNRLNVAYEINEHLMKRSSSLTTLDLLLHGLESTWGSIKPLATKSSWLTRTVSSTVYTLCNFKLPGGTALKDVSATLQQVDTRLEQATILPSQLHVIKQRDRQRITYSTIQYISFYNCLWLIINDVIIGITIGAILTENSELFGQLLGQLTRTYTIELIQDTLLWLDNWPIGLKLNTELSRFLCAVFIGLSDVWSWFLQGLIRFYPSLIYLLGMSGWLGSTMILSSVADALSIVTLHIYLSYLVATAMVSSSLSLAGSLWRLFRGKRRNVLRNRTDSWDYDLDQLLLGSILFTLLAFLFPTVLAYYTFFALTRVVIIFVHASLETCISFMNHYPLFTMMLRLKDPARLPGGVYFDTSRIAQSYIEIKNQPISYGRIFSQYVRLWSKLSAHYSPRRLLRCLVTGTVITPIQRYQIRYSMIQRSRSAEEERSLKEKTE